MPCEYSNLNHIRLYDITKKCQPNHLNYSDFSLRAVPRYTSRTKYSRMNQVKFFESCLPQILLVSFLNTYSHLIYITSRESLTSNDLSSLNKVKTDKTRIFLKCFCNEKKKIAFKELTERFFNIYSDEPILCPPACMRQPGSPF